MEVFEGHVPEAEKGAKRKKKWIRGRQQTSVEVYGDPVFLGTPRPGQRNDLKLLQISRRYDSRGFTKFHIREWGRRNSRRE